MYSLDDFFQITQILFLVWGEIREPKAAKYFIIKSPLENIICYWQWWATSKVLQLKIPWGSISPLCCLGQFCSFSSVFTSLPGLIVLPVPPSSVGGWWCLWPCSNLVQWKVKLGSSSEPSVQIWTNWVHVTCFYPIGDCSGPLSFIWPSVL